MAFGALWVVLMATVLTVFGLVLLYTPSVAHIVAMAALMMLAGTLLLRFGLPTVLDGVKAEHRRHRDRVDALRQEWLRAGASEGEALLRSADGAEQTLLRAPGAPTAADTELLVRPSTEPDATRR